MKIYNYTYPKTISQYTKSNNNTEITKQNITNQRNTINNRIHPNSYSAYILPFLGSSKKKNQNNEYSLNELSDEEFNKLKTKYQKLFNKKGIEVELDKYNIQLADIIFSDKNLYNNKNLIFQIEDILNYENDLDLLKSRYMIVKNVLKHEKLLQNKNFMNSALVWVLNDNVLNREEAEAKCIIMDKIATTEKLYNNKQFMDQEANALFAYTYTRGAANNKCKAIDKILAKPDLLSNKVFKMNINKIYMCSSNKESLPLIDMIMTNPDLYNNRKFLDYSGDILGNTDSKARFILAKKILSTPELYNNSNILSSAGKILFSTATEEQAKFRNDILNKYIKLTKDTNNNLLDAQIGNIINETKTQEQTKLINKILNNKVLYNNPNIITKNIVEIISKSRTQESADAKCNFIDKILTTKELKDINVINKLGSILWNINTNQQEQIKSTLIDKVISDKNLCNNEDFTKYLGNILIATNTKLHSEFIDLILSDEKFYTNSTLLAYTPNILSYINSEEQINLTKRILLDEKLYNNKHIIKNLPEIISHIKTTTEYENTLKVIDLIESAPEFMSIANVSNNLGSIIEHVTPKKFELFKHLTQEEGIIECLKNEELNNNSSLILRILKNNKPLDVNNINNYEKALEYSKEGIKFKDQLRSEDEDITNSDIYEVFITHSQELAEAEEICGKDTILATLPLKLSGVEDFLTNMSYLYTDISFHDNKKLLISKLNPNANPKVEELKKEILALKKEYKAAEEKGGITFDNLKKEINTKNQELRKLQNAKVNLEPQTKIDRLLSLAALVQSDGFKIIDFINLIKDDTPENNAAWNEAINKAILKRLAIDYDKITTKKLNLESSKHIDKILRADKDFTEYFSDLYDLLQKNRWKSIKDTLNDIPQNIETRNQFEAMHLDYDKWVDFDENSNITLNIKLDSQHARQSAIKNLEADFNDVIYKTLPEAQKEKLNEILNKENVYLRKTEEIVYANDGIETEKREVLKLYEGNDPIKFKKLPKLISILKENMNQDNFWTQEHEEEEINTAARTFYNHITKLRNTEIKQAEKNKSDNNIQIKIQKTDMNDIKHSLFLGNHASCCTAVGTGCNQFSAPTYIMTKAISAIEIISGKNFIGNSMCYIAEVDGIPSLILDNIEIKTQYQFNDKLRDAFMEYAKKLTEEIGEPNMPIYAGPFRHKLNMDIYPYNEHTVTIKGSSGNQEVYIDYITAGSTLEERKDDVVNLYKIR